MALMADVKMLRRKVVGDAVHQLRLHIGVSQTQLGRMIDATTGGNNSTTDGGSVSRWERGEILPNEWKRKELVRIARDNGRNDLANLIDDPVGNWRNALRSNNKDLFELITLLEICALNQHVLGDLYGAALTEVAWLIRDQLEKRFTVEHPPILIDDYHRAFWTYITKEIERGRNLHEQTAGEKANQAGTRFDVRELQLDGEHENGEEAEEQG